MGEARHSGVSTARAVEDIVYDKNPPKVTIDFETRSACSIKDCGSWRYSLDPTTQVMCRFPSTILGEGWTALWHPGVSHLGLDEVDCEELDELFVDS